MNKRKYPYTINKSIKEYTKLYKFLKENDFYLDNIKTTETRYGISTYEFSPEIIKYMAEAQEVIIYPYYDLDTLYTSSYDVYIRAHINRDEQVIRKNKIKRLFDGETR